VKVRWATVAKTTSSEAKSRIQATILKKCDRSSHHPETSKRCAARDRGESRGACQHTCEPGQVETCRHAWTVRYNVGGVQRDKSFQDELYDGSKRVKPNSGLRKAQDFQLELTRGKRAQGKTYTDPKLAEESFMANATAFVTRSARLQAAERTRQNYLGLLNGDIRKAFGDRTLAQMSTPQAAEEVAAFLNVTIAHRSTVRRQHARMIIVWTMDAAVNADKIGRHKLQGITLTEGTAIPRRQRAADEEDDETATGFVFVTDEQARTLAEGGKFPAAPESRSQRPRQLLGLGIAAWLQRTMGRRYALTPDRGNPQSPFPPDPLSPSLRSLGSLRSRGNPDRNEAERANAQYPKVRRPSPHRHRAAAQVPAVPKTRPPRALPHSPGKTPPPPVQGHTAPAQRPALHGQDR
jgi:hypothetical protein